jgi:hypothetical protein
LHNGNGICGRELVTKLLKTKPVTTAREVAAAAFYFRLGTAFRAAIEHLLMFSVTIIEPLSAPEHREALNKAFGS